jgi:PelA/Pel-15E family pectate lyase
MTVLNHRSALRLVPVIGVLLALVAVAPAAADSFPWQRYSEYPNSWYDGFEAKQIAANVLSHQSPQGDWPKNIDTGAKKYEGDPKALRGTFEGGATLGELRFLARIFRVTNNERYRPAFELGLKHLLDAQTHTGGWPLLFPQPKGAYFRLITVHDGHMVNILELLRDAADAREYSFVRKTTRDAARDAFQRGVECLLKCQIVVDDEPTAWCARYDEKTLEPRPGRRSEPVAFDAADTAGILQLLMSLDDPNFAVVRAVHSGCAWLEAAKLAGIRVEKKGNDVVAIRSLRATHLWARLYEIGKNRPIFTKRDGTVMYKLEEIEQERRVELTWYGPWGDAVLQRYANWKDQSP